MSGSLSLSHGVKKERVEGKGYFVFVKRVVESECAFSVKRVLLSYEVSVP